MARQLYRSRDGEVAGVCKGIADALEVDVDLVRILAVLGVVLTSAPVLAIYVGMAIFVPLAPKDDAEGDTAMSWGLDSASLTFSAPLVPHAIGWPWWLGGYTAGVFGLVVLTNLMLATTTALAMLLGVDPAMALMPIATVNGLLSTFLPLTPLLLFLGLLRRPFTLTCTHDAVWLDRAGVRQPRRIPLADVESLTVDGARFLFHLRSGEQVTMPAPPPSDERDAFVEQVTASRRRALEHKVDLEAADAHRRELERVLVRAAPTDRIAE